MKKSDRLKLQILSGHASEAQMAEAGYDEIFSMKTARDSMLLRDFSDFEVKKIGERRFSFAFSNEKVDQGGDILLAKGWDLKVFKTNPVMLWGHDGHSRPPVGTVPKIGRDADVGGFKGLAGEVEFATRGIDPFIDTVEALVEDRVIKATSVGCMLLQTKKIESQDDREALGLGPFGVLSEKHRLFEISLVSIGMNSDALVRSCEVLLSKERATKAGVEQFLKSQPMTERDCANVISWLCKENSIQIPWDMEATDNGGGSASISVTGTVGDGANTWFFDRSGMLTNAPPAEEDITTKEMKHSLDMSIKLATTLADENGELHAENNRLRDKLAAAGVPSDAEAEAANESDEDDKQEGEKVRGIAHRLDSLAARL